LFDLFSNQRAQLVIGCFLGIAVTDAAPRKQIRTIAHMKAILVTPADKFKILDFGLHLAASPSFQPQSVNHQYQYFEGTGDKSSLRDDPPAI
jgi:hypothetical protein